MTIDFSKINDERVGYEYELKANRRDCQSWIEPITFREFILPYIHEAREVRQVYQNLEYALTKSIEKLDSRLRKSQVVAIENIASESLQREAIRNAQALIQRNYLDL